MSGVGDGDRENAAKIFADLAIDLHESTGVEETVETVVQFALQAISCTHAAVVLATGGGAVLLPENRRHLAERGSVIYLETTAAQQAKRLRRSRNRPLLSNVNVLAKLEQLTRERAPLYAEIADITVTTDGRGIGSVVDEIARILPHAREHSDSRTRQP